MRCRDLPGRSRRPRGRPIPRQAADDLGRQSLRSGETSLALAGGVNVMAGPGLTRVLDEAGATSPDGRSKSFDAAADGYGRCEGAGIVVLKLLSDALRDGDRILALLRGTAVSQDGRTGGIMALNGEAQKAVARQAWRQAGISPSTAGYVEAHGTGTRKGDPIEVAALSRVFGTGRAPESPCLIGTVKPNIGHLEAGAGIAGVIKAVLALRHGRIPATPNVSRLSPDIPWETSGLRVVTEAVGWPEDGRIRRAGVSSFGYGGTVAHAVLEQAPDGAGPGPEPDPEHRGENAEEGADDWRVLMLSGAPEAGVRAAAGRLGSWMADADSGAAARVSLADVAHTLGLRRSHLFRRAAVLAPNRASAIRTLRALAEEAVDSMAVQGAAPGGPPRPSLWVFSGHGSQWVGMGRELLSQDTHFAATIEKIDEVYRAEIGFSPRAILLGGALQDVHEIQTLRSAGRARRAVAAGLIYRGWARTGRPERRRRSRARFRPRRRPGPTPVPRPRPGARPAARSSPVP
jgi:6-methylsalicylic acid synthase